MINSVIKMRLEVFIDRAVQVVEWREEWPDESEAIIYCTPQDAVKNMNLGAGIDPTAVRIAGSVQTSAYSARCFVEM